MKGLIFSPLPQVSAEAMRVCEQMVGVLCPPGGGASLVDSDLQPLVRPLFDTIMQKLGAQDQDQV